MTTPNLLSSALPRADEPVRSLAARGLRRATGRLPSAFGATGCSIAVHGIALAVALVAFAAPPPLDSAGSALQISLAPDMGDESLYEEDLGEMPPLEEPIEMEELPEPVIAEATPLEERPFEDDELLEDRLDFTDPAEVPELSVAVVGVRLPRRQAPTAPPPPAVTTAPVPVRAVVPPHRAAPQPIRVRSATTPAVGAGRRGGATGTGRLVPTHRPHHYPASARGRGLTGVARVEMLVAPDGTVARVRLVASSGHPTLDEAALGSARQWRYRAPGEWRRARQSFTFMFR